MNRPITTLFLLTSVDGKISTGDTGVMDVDKDFPKIPELAAGLHQYYDIEQTTDLYSLNSGKVLAKVGINEKTDVPPKTPVSFIVIDNQPHLKESGVKYLAAKSKHLFIVTTNSAHPVYQVKADNVTVLHYKQGIDFTDLFSQLKNQYEVGSLTIQTGGTLNAIFLRSGLVDKLLFVVAPVLIGGKDTPSLIDGESLHAIHELNQLKTLKFMKAEPLEHSYLRLEYEVLN
jgi:2,5-diamino-6-(ribosylamino)-4(3H)-pyrimidinone 5'-phosphate reductase